MKGQLTVKGRRVMCTAFGHGRRHDYHVFKRSKTRLLPTATAQVDTGYLGIDKLHANSRIPKKRSKNRPLTRADKRRNREIARERVEVEHVIRMLKRYRVISGVYRNRRKRFGLRFNLIAGIYNYELG
jgi:hypothetical protein